MCSFPARKGRRVSRIETIKKLHENMSIQTISFKDTGTDLAALGQVCRELEDRGIPPKDAAAHVLADMANQAIANGMDARGVIDALHRVINERPSDRKVSAQAVQDKRGGGVPLTKEQADEIRKKVKSLQNFLLYWDMILCTEIQRYAHSLQESLKEKGMYNRELKKYSNELNDEARRLQMRVKDNDRAKVLKWVERIDPKAVYGKDYRSDGGSLVNRLALSFQNEFRKEWAVVEYDCLTVARRSPSNVSDMVATLLKIEALTNTGIEFFETCVGKMKALVAGHGRASIIKSPHHESMRCSCWNLLRQLGVNLHAASETERRYAREHLTAMQLKMETAGMGDFFQKEFDRMGEEFTDYMIARMRIGIQKGKVETGGIRLVFERLGTKHRVRKFFRQLAEIPIPEGTDTDVFNVADAVDAYDGNRSELNRFRKFCVEDKRFEQPESEIKQEARMLRVLARRNNYMLPDDILRVMIMKHGTKKELTERLSRAGFELAPTLRRVRRMKVAELKQL